MALPALTFVDPHWVPFMRWASVMTEDLAAYNVPNPVNEDLWRSWAEVVSSLPDVAELGLLDPSMFSEWKSWATAFLQVAT